MYCPPERHQTESDMLPLEKLQEYWIKLYEKTKHLNKPYKISFTGGEVTINKDFIPFLDWLRYNYGDKIAQMGVTTNGSASVTYYLKLFEYINFISFSTHTEHINEEKFFASANACNQYARKHPNKSFMINIMEEFWATEKIKEYKKRCEEYDIDCSISKIEYSYKTRDIPIFKNGIVL